MKAMDTKPYINETRKEIGAIFKKYDRANKGHIDLNDLKEINRHLKENVDDEVLKLMMEKVDSNRDGKISFEDFYSVMVKTFYWRWYVSKVYIDLDAHFIIHFSMQLTAVFFHKDHFQWT